MLDSYLTYGTVGFVFLSSSECWNLSIFPLIGCTFSTIKSQIIKVIALFFKNPLHPQSSFKIKMGFGFLPSISEQQFPLFIFTLLFQCSRAWHLVCGARIGGRRWDDESRWLEGMSSPALLRDTHMQGVSWISAKQYSICKKTWLNSIPLLVAAHFPFSSSWSRLQQNASLICPILFCFFFFTLLEYSCFTVLC